MRFGVVGTGFWAGHAHAAGIAANPGATLAGVWGRDAPKAIAFADRHDCAAFDRFDDMLQAVDAVSFSVPPSVQAELAVEAARAGKHLLLEKPVSLTVEAADRLCAAVDAAGVATVVFVTACFTPERRAWLADSAGAGPWRGANALFLGSAFAPGSPFDTPWRHEYGALWDVGPHLLAGLIDTLGPISRVLSAARGDGDLVHFVLQHDGGATSAVTATLEAGTDAFGSRVCVWGDSAVRDMPESIQVIHETFSTAVGELMASASTGVRSAYDVHFGREIVRRLAEVDSLCGGRGF
jgi:predicted dehydrogenase